ncbi:MAG: FAD:protein FMN transferase [Lentisphaerae bacterium]|nr:FAD:protein FMN transferase [Lentisphaerota bacterium]
MVDVRCSVAIVLLCVLSLSCRRASPPLSEHWSTMGTFASVSVGAGRAEELAACVRQTKEVFEDLNQRLSTYVDASEISQLNDAAGGEPVALSTTTRDMLRLSIHYAEMSGGAFDVSVAPLMHLWGFRGGEPPVALPEAVALERLLPLVDFRLIEQSATGARLPWPGMRIDLGGIAKGYAVDRGFEALEQAGHHDILVNLGGNMRAIGSPEPGRAWRVGVRNPFDLTALLGTVELADGWSLATSGNYEQFIEIGGTRYAHIMDPRTGAPVQGMAGVTLLSRRAVEADALSTALFVAGLVGAPAILALAPDSEALLVPDRQPLEIYMTPGFARHFTPDPAFAERIRLIE